VLFIVAAVLFVGALVFAIISFTGKNSEADDKEKAQKELAATKKELEDTQGELGTQRGAGQLLGRLVNTGESAADNLKACTDAGFDLRQQIIGVLNDRQAGDDVNPRIDALNATIDQNDAQCNNASSAYQDFKGAVADIRNR
jgi:flagellar basal body-associated protein FliL